MKRPWSMTPLSKRQLLHRSAEPVFVDGCIVNDCVEMDDYAEMVQVELSIASVEFTTLWESGDMPVLKHDDAFKRWRQTQIEENTKLRDERITCTLPWQVLKHLPSDRKKSDRLYFTQGARPSCSGHADGFGHHSTTLQLIARGASLIYCSFNPIVTWGITKGDSISGGQTVAEMAKGANVIGHFPEYLVGTDNQRIPDYKAHLDEAKKYQSAIIFLDFQGKQLADDIIQCCAAGLSVALGNSGAVSGSAADRNGVKIAQIRGTWAHATHFTGFRTVGGTEYVGWVNSHGDRYKSSDEGEPADMCWMTRTLVEQFVATAPPYGPLYVIFPESVSTLDTSLYVRYSIPFPDNWRF